MLKNPRSLFHLNSYSHICHRKSLKLYGEYNLVKLYFRLESYSYCHLYSSESNLLLITAVKLRVHKLLAPLLDAEEEDLAKQDLQQHKIQRLMSKITLDMERKVGLPSD